MALSRFPSWLRSRTDALVIRCAAMIQRRRMHRARALLPQESLRKAAFWRALYLSRDARLQREREARHARRQSQASPGDEIPAAQDISKADVLAAIARSRAHREARLKAVREDGANR